MTKNLVPGSLVWRKDVHVGLVDHYGVVLSVDPLVVAHIDKDSRLKLRVRLESMVDSAARVRREAPLRATTSSTARALRQASTTSSVGARRRRERGEPRRLGTRPRAKMCGR